MKNMLLLNHLVQASFDKDADDFGGAGREGQGCGDAAVGGLPGGGALLPGDNPPYFFEKY